MVLLIIVAVVLMSVTAVYLFMQGAPFGRKPSGERMKAIQQSPNYRDGQFQNVHKTPQLTGDANMLTVMREFFFGDKSKRKPPAPLPSQKADLHRLDPNKNLLVWFGHSSYFIQVDGKKILVDPVFSGDASPLKGANKSFPGSDVYSADDMPDIDYLIITHDHWDHLDYPTVKQLRPKVKNVITTLGVGAHLERWGYQASAIREGDWGNTLKLDDGFVIHLASARHFSGRGFKRNGTLWASFVLVTPTKKLYLGGDSGYDTHFAEIGTAHGPFDLAILEDGQYNKNWRYIHMLPDEVVQAAKDLKAKRLLPVHWGKFALSLHDWDEPIKKVVEISEQAAMPLLHPMIGQVVDIDEPGRQEQWWEGVK